MKSRKAGKESLSKSRATNPTVGRVRWINGFSRVKIINAHRILLRFSFKFWNQVGEILIGKVQGRVGKNHGVTDSDSRVYKRVLI